MFNRAQAFKKFVRNYLTLNPLPLGEKLGIVCHSQFICGLTATHCDENTAMVNFKYPENC